MESQDLVLQQYTKKRNQNQENVSINFPDHNYVTSKLKD